jgi:hypothetical protein
MQFIVPIPIFAKEILNGDSHTYGFLMGALRLCALTRALYLTSRKKCYGSINNYFSGCLYLWSGAIHIIFFTILFHFLAVMVIV